MQEILGLGLACRWWTESAHDRWWTGPAYGRQWPAVVLGLMCTHWCVRLVSRLAQAACGQGRAPGVSGSGVCPLVGGPGPQGPRGQVPASPSSACVLVCGAGCAGAAVGSRADQTACHLGRRWGRVPAWLVAGPEASHPVCVAGGPGAEGSGLEGGSHRGANLTSVASHSAAGGPPLLPSCGGPVSLLSCGRPLLATPVTVLILVSPGGLCSGSLCSAVPAGPSRRLSACLCGRGLGFGGCPSLADFSLC